MGRPHKIFYVMLEFSERPKTPGINLKIIWLALMGINHLGVTCMMFWIKQRLISKIQTNETENGSSDIKDPSAETFQLQMPVLHQSKCILHLKGWSLTFRTRVWAEYKDKVPDVSDSHQNIETSCNFNLELPNLKICISKLQKGY